MASGESSKQKTAQGKWGQAFLEEARQNRRAFKDFNERKTRKILSDLDPAGRAVFLVLPALIHMNAPGYPGYIAGKEVPSGVFHYNPSAESRRALKELFPHTAPPPRMTGRPMVESLALMGSIGSIAQTSKSDFDFWVCVEDEALGPERLELLAERLRALEGWACSAEGLIANFFLTDIAAARRDDFGEVGAESAGSALGKLLKEEFYRTSTLIAGKVPLWWVLPPGLTDEEHGELRDLLDSQWDLSEFIDLGNVQRISYEETFGACLWQVNKAFESPFKSAMKMALLEAYMGAEEGKPLLCEELKARVQQAERDSPAIDPYLMMFDRILEYNASQGRSEALELLRKCLYLKVGVPVEDPEADDPHLDPRVRIMAGYARRWGWGPERLRELNQFRSWPFENAVSLGREINRFIIEVYKRLGDLSERNLIKRTSISATDLTLLGRKLFTFYARKPHKVEFLPRGLEESFYQEALTLCPSRTPDGHQFWRLYRGRVGREDILQGKADHLILRRAGNLPATFCWVINSGMYDRDTALSLISSDIPLTVPDLQELLNELLDYFPRLEISHLGKEDLLQESRLERLFVILNFGKEKHLSQLSRLELCYRTTWGELFYEGWDGLKGLEEGLEKVLKTLSRGKSATEFPVKVFIPSGRTGPFARSLWLNFERLLRETSEFFLSEPPSGERLRHFVFQEGGRLKAICQRDNGLELSQHGIEEDFCNRLDRTGTSANLVRVDSGSSALDLLRTVTDASRPGRVQLFFFDNGFHLRAFISDEACAMLAYSWPRQEWEFYAAKLYSFMARVLARKVDGAPAAPAWPLEFFEITSGRPPAGSFGLQDVTHEFQRKSMSRRALEEHLSVSEEPLPGVKDGLSFRMGDEELKSSRFGKGLFREVVRRIVERRSQKVRYPIYLTDLELPKSFCEAHCPKGPQTIHFLLYKHQVEQWLNQALREL